MIFGFFKRKETQEESEEVEYDPVRFLGAMNGQDANLAANERLAEAGLVPAKDVVTDALSRRADTIRIEPKGPQSVVTVLIDGIPYSGGKLPGKDGMAVTQMLKLLAGLDIKQRKKAQQGGIKAEFNSKAYQILVNSAPVPEGERLTVRLVDTTLKLETPAEVGMGESLHKRLREICQEKGLLLVVGPASSGTSTTMYAAVRGLDAFVYSIYTIGDIGGRKLNNVTAFEVNPDDSLLATLDRVIRVEADVIVPDPIKEAETAKVILSKAPQITLITEMTAKDVPTALLQLIQWTGDAQVVAKGVRGVLTQKLIRVLCTDCRQVYRPKVDFLKKVGLPADTTNLYRKAPEPVATNPNEPPPGPCEKCGGTGYFGRTAMFELLDMSEEMQQVLTGKPDAVKIRAQMKKEKMLTLQQDGLRLVAEGRTSLEELQRVFKTPT